MDLRSGFATWRRLGPVDGTRLAARYAWRTVETPAHRWRLRLAPPSIDEGELRRALGGAAAGEALAGSLDALPTVTRWLADLTDDHASVLDRAELLLAHEFDLLGSGPVGLGNPIDWHSDFKDGRRWPLRHISQTVVSYPDGSDIKVPWELSRLQHLPLLAAAYRITGDERFRVEVRDQLADWRARNPVEFGPNWACTMDVAIRAVNWLAAVALLAEDDPSLPWLEESAAALLEHCRFIRSHLEWGEVRGNHYLSDVAGLLVAAAPFRGSREGRRLIDWATGELEAEMAHQVRADGCDHEASLPYHRLVTELFLVATQAADVLAPGALGDAYREKLDRMLDVVAATTRPDGLSPQVGDADSGRFLPLGDYRALDPRDHRHLFRQAGRPVPESAHSTALPGGGLFVLRSDDLFVLVRCGDNGLDGIGGHAHNDQLSFELAVGGEAIVVDPGAYLYTADPEARNRFRSTAAHATLQVADWEQNPLDDAYLFRLPDHTRAEQLEFTDDRDAVRFRGRHHGFTDDDPAAVHERTVTLEPDTRRLVVEDVVQLSAPQSLTLRFPLAPGVEATLERPEKATLREGAVVLSVEVKTGALRVDGGLVSPEYGRSQPAAVLVLEANGRAGENRIRTTFTVQSA